MLWHMLSAPGMEVSPLACPAWMRRRAMSGRVQPRASRCWRSQVPSSVGMTPSFAVRRFPDTPGVRERPAVSPGCCRGGARGWSGEQVVGEAGFGALDEGADLAGLQDECGAGGVGGLAQGDLAAGEFLGFQARTAVGAAPGFAPAVGAEVGGGHAVVDVHGQISLAMLRSMAAVLSAGAARALRRSRAWT